MRRIQIQTIITYADAGDAELLPIAENTCVLELAEKSVGLISIAIPYKLNWYGAVTDCAVKVEPGFLESPAAVEAVGVVEELVCQQ